jgi:hypothetical protein
MSTMDFFSAMRSWGPGVQADAAALRKEATNPSETGENFVLCAYKRTSRHERAVCVKLVYFKPSLR